MVVLRWIGFELGYPITMLLSRLENNLDWVLP